MKLDRLVVEDYVIKRCSEGAATGRMAFRAVRSFYRWAVERKVVAVAPTEGIESPPEALNPTPATATQQDVDRMIEAIDLTDDHGIRDTAFIATLWATCRPPVGWDHRFASGEVLRMEMGHLSLESRTVLIPVTKTKRPRNVALTQQAMDHLLEWLEVRYSWEPTTDHVWLSRRGGPPVTLTSNAARLAFERRRHAAGLDHLTPHALRRGWAAETIRQGVSTVSVQRLGG